MLDDLRQLLFPREFRIRASRTAVTAGDPDQMMEALSTLMREEAGAADMDVILPVANETWRLGKRLEKMSDETQRLRLTAVLRGLQEVLDKQGAQVFDFTGQEYNPDETWDKVIGTPANDGSARVADMTAPRIFLRGAMIQAGTVIVRGKD